MSTHARQATRFCTLLIGLPALLHVLLFFTPHTLGSWPATIATLLIGVGLAVRYDRRPVPLSAPIGSVRGITTH